MAHIFLCRPEQGLSVAPEMLTAVSPFPRPMTFLYRSGPSVYGRVYNSNSFTAARIPFEVPFCQELATEAANSQASGISCTRDLGLSDLDVFPFVPEP